jgi:hypothetical protein
VRRKQLFRILGLAFVLFVTTTAAVYAQTSRSPNGPKPTPPASQKNAANKSRKCGALYAGVALNAGQSARFLQAKALN